MAAAMLTTETVDAPVSKICKQHASNVAPVVTTSSTSKTCLFLTFCTSFISNTSDTLYILSVLDLPVWDLVSFVFTKSK